MSCCCRALPVGVFLKPVEDDVSVGDDVSLDIEELVKHYGGNVDAELRFSMMWNSWSDVDFHLESPKREIFYNARSDGHGVLDVDMNVESRPRPGADKHAVPAIENISYAIYDTSPNGEYRMGFKQYDVWDERPPKGDVPLFSVTRKYKIPDSQELKTDVLVLELDWDNLEDDDKANVALFRKQGPIFKLLKLAPGVTIKHFTGTKITIPEQIEQIEQMNKSW